MSFSFWSLSLQSSFISHTITVRIWTPSLVYVHICLSSNKFSLKGSSMSFENLLLLFFSSLVLSWDNSFSWQKIRLNAFKKSWLGRLAFLPSSAAHVKPLSVFSSWDPWVHFYYPGFTWVSVNVSLSLYEAP